MTLFLDTNILFDSFLNREGFSESANAILNLSKKDNYKLAILALSIPNLHYSGEENLHWKPLLGKLFHLLIKFALRFRLQLRS